jgi:hypothetical protein
MPSCHQEHERECFLTVELRVKDKYGPTILLGSSHSRGSALVFTYMTVTAVILSALMRSSKKLQHYNRIAMRPGDLHRFQVEVRREVRNSGESVAPMAALKKAVGGNS